MQKGIFPTKFFYKELIGGSTEIPFPFKRIWNPIVPSKVSFFLWNTYPDKILTLNHLQNRGWNLANICIMCIKEAKLVNHLFGIVLWQIESRAFFFLIFGLLGSSLNGFGT